MTDIASKFLEFDETLLDFFDSKGKILEFEDLDTSEFIQQSRNLDKQQLLKRKKTPGQVERQSSILIIHHCKQRSEELSGDDNFSFRDIRNAVKKRSKKNSFE